MRRLRSGGTRETAYDFGRPTHNDDDDDDDIAEFVATQRAPPAA